MTIPALSSVDLAKIFGRRAADASHTCGSFGLFLVASRERSKTLLSVSQTSKRRSFSISGICDKVWAMSGSRVSHRLVLGDNLQIFVLRALVLVFNHDFTNRGLLREI